MEVGRKSTGCVVSDRIGKDGFGIGNFVYYYTVYVVDISACFYSNTFSTFISCLFTKCGTRQVNMLNACMELHMDVCMCVCVRVCVHICVYVNVR